MRIGPSINDVETSADSTSIAVAGEVTVYTKAFKLTYAEYFALCYKAASDGTVNVKIELEQSWTKPSTEGSSDSNYVVPKGMAAVDTVTDEVQHHATLNPIALPWARLKLTGLTGNDASTVLRIRRSAQEEI